MPSWPLLKSPVSRYFIDTTQGLLTWLLVAADSDVVSKGKGSVTSDVESVHKHDGHFADSIVSKIIGVAILEFGVVLHRYLLYPSLINLSNLLPLSAF